LEKNLVGFSEVYLPSEGLTRKWAAGETVMRMRLTRWEGSEAGERTGEGNETDDVGVVRGR